MNLISDFKLHGISPIYDQVIFVRCHLCKLIIKLPYLVEHLQKRHRITDDSNEATLSELIISEQQSLAVSEEKSLAGVKSGRKASNSRAKSQSLSYEAVDTNGASTKLVKVKSKPRKLSKADKNELKKSETLPGITATASLPLLSSILDESIDDISCSVSESSNLMASENNINGDLRFKYVVDQKVKTTKTTKTAETLFASSTATPDGIHKKLCESSVKPPLQAVKANTNGDSQILHKKNKLSSCSSPFHATNTNTTTTTTNNNNINLKQSPVDFVEIISAKTNYQSPQRIASVECSSYGVGAANLAVAKAYDPNKHCGVVIEEVDSVNGTKLTREPCTRSLTCKKHSINLRRQVAGRCKSFNELFKEYRDEKLSTNQLVNTNKSFGDCVTTGGGDNSADSTPSKRAPLTFPFLSATNGDSCMFEPADFQIGSSIGTNNDNILKPDYQDHLARNTNGGHMNGTSNFEFVNYQNNPTGYHQDHVQNSLNEQYLNQYNYSKMFFHHDQYQASFNNLNNSQNSSALDHNHPHYHQQQNLMFKPINTGVSASSTATNQHQFSSSQATNIPSANTRPLNYEEMSQHLNLNYFNKMLVKHHPRPSAVSSFNARLTDNGGGYTMWDRRQDNLRILLSNAFSQTENFLDKNVSYTSCIDTEPPRQQSKINMQQQQNNVNFNNSLPLPTSSSPFKCDSHQSNKTRNGNQTNSCYNDLAPSSSNGNNNYLNHQKYQHNHQQQKTPNGSKKRSNSNSNGTSPGDTSFQHSFNNGAALSNSEALPHYLPTKLAKPNSSVHSLNTNNKGASPGNTSLNDVYNNMKRYQQQGFVNNSEQFLEGKSVMKSSSGMNKLAGGQLSQPLNTTSTGNFVKYSSDNSKATTLDTNNSILDSRKTLKSISLSPSPSSSSSASNCSSNNNKPNILFNSIN